MSTIVLAPGERISLPPQKRGDTWPGFSGILPEASGIDLTGATISMGFTKSAEASAKSPTLTTTDAQIEVVDSLTYRIPHVILPLGVGLWYWDLQFDLIAGPFAGWRLTLFSGTLPITNDQTL